MRKITAQDIAAMSPEEQKHHIDAMLGLKDPNEGDYYPAKQVDDILSNHPNLTPEQIETVKDGDDGANKIALFHNPHLDLEHLKDMHGRWTNDDVGYDRDELKNHLFDKFIENDNNNLFETQAAHDARNKIEARHPPEKFYREHGHEVMGVPSKDHWIEPRLEDMDWNHTDEEGNETDYSHNMEDHPEYYNRWGALREDYSRELNDRISNNDIPDSLRDDYEEEIADKLHDLTEYNFKKEIHLNPEALPEKLADHIRSQGLSHLADSYHDKGLKEAKREENTHGAFLSRTVPNRPHEREYGEGQHHLEMVKDYADANGGSIDVGHLNKVHPNLTSRWKEIFGNKGKLSSEEVQEKINAHPKTKYTLSYSNWGGEKSQNINKQDQVVVRLDHSADSIKHINSDLERAEVFNHLQKVSKRSGHPSNSNTIGWARVDFTNKEHPFIDELQSDFASNARKYLEAHGATQKAAKIQEIIDIHKNWRENILNAVQKLAKQNGAKTLSTHSPESKSAHTDSSKIHSVYKDSYEKIPRQMGFQKVTPDKLPLAESGKRHFIVGPKPGGPRSADEIASDHLDSMRIFAEAHNGHENALKQDHEKMAPVHKKFMQAAEQQYEKHKQKLLELKPQEIPDTIQGFDASERSVMPPEILEPVISRRTSDAIVRAKHDTDSYFPRLDPLERMAKYPLSHHMDLLNEKPDTQTPPNMGHQLDLRPESLKKPAKVSKSEPMITAKKLKVAEALIAIQKMSKPLEEMRNSDPHAYRSVVALAEQLKSLYEKLSNEPIDAAVHQLQIQNEIKPEEQPQAQPQQEAPPTQNPSEHISTPPHSKPITHGKMVYAPGSVREYQPGQARMKTADGRWVSVAGGKARDPLEG